MSEKKIFSHPGHEMIFKYNLMKKVRCDKLVDVGTGKIICKWLKKET